MMSSSRACMLLATACVVVGASLPLLAQHQIVGGRVLDSNLAVGSGGINPGMRPRSYTPYSTSSVSMSTRSASRSVTYGGATGGVSRQGFTTLGYGLSRPTYNPLSTARMVQRSPTASGVSPAYRTSPYPSYSRGRPPSMSRPAYMPVHGGQ